MPSDVYIILNAYVILRSPPHVILNAVKDLLSKHEVDIFYDLY